MSNIKKDAPPTTSTTSTVTKTETFETQLKELKKSQEEQYLLLSKVNLFVFYVLFEYPAFLNIHTTIFLQIIRFYLSLFYKM